MTPKGELRRAPREVEGTKVQALDSDPIVVWGVKWFTLVPVDDDDDRLWEYSPTLNRLIRTR